MVGWGIPRAKSEPCVTGSCVIKGKMLEEGGSWKPQARL